MVAIRRVVLPVRRVMCRYVKAERQFVPCDWTDSRGSLIVDVDQLGRSVISVHGEHGEQGWKLSPGQVNDSSIFKAWVQSHSKISEMEQRK